jgi:elongation factor Ts
MNITAQDVNRLRAETGAGMMDCKKALQESGGDFDKAIEYLRKKGQKVSADRQDREAKEGAIFALVSGDQSYGIILELNCETDFVARNEGFQQLGQKIAAAALAAKVRTLDELKALPLDGQTVAEALTEAVGRIGEKIEVSKYALQEGEKVVAYVHPGSRVGVLTVFAGAGDVDLTQAGKDVCMQVAAMSPIAVDKSGVDPSIVQKEIAIGMEQARAEGKPEAMLEKIAQGKLQKFYKENTLMEQDFVKDPSKSIAQYLKGYAPTLVVTAFTRFNLG